MKKSFITITALLTFILMVVTQHVTFTQSENPKHSFIGASKCGMCHKKDADGNKFKVWQGSKHAEAFKTLQTKKADDIAQKMGITKKAAEAPECLVCHVTAFNVDAKFLVKGFNIEDGVQCESCHGPGNDYKSIKIMKDEKEAAANGLITYKNDDEIKKLCAQCHNKKSPSYKDFDFAKRWAAIKHDIK